MPVSMLGPGDWERKRALRLRALREAPEAYGSTYERERHRGETEWRPWPHPGAFFAATVDGADVGVACGWRSNDDPAATNLIGMWVAPEVRGRRIAAELIDAVVGWAHEQGSARVELEVANGNETAMKVYLRAGFERSTRAPHTAGGTTLRLRLSER